MEEIYCVNDDLTARNWMALCITICNNQYSPDRALSYMKVKDKIRSSGKTVKERNKQFNAEHGRYLELPIEELKYLYLKGYRVEKIGAVYGVSFATVQNRLKAAGVPARGPKGKRGSNTKASMEEILEDIKNWREKNEQNNSEW